MNFSWIVLASGCKLVKPNHLNLGVLHDYLLFFYSASLVIPKISFVTGASKINSNTHGFEIYNHLQ
jgi:hypothetical protein